MLGEIQSQSCILLVCGQIPECFCRARVPLITAEVPIVPCQEPHQVQVLCLGPW